MSPAIQTLIVAAIVVACLVILVRRGLRVVRGVRENRNCACESCGFSGSCTSAKEKRP